MSAEQKKVVLKVLNDLGFEKSFYTQKMIEVWNKIDLLEEPLNYDEIQKSDYPIIPISATHGTNIETLLETITHQIKLLQGKKLYTLNHSSHQHGERLRWLFK